MPQVPRANARQEGKDVQKAIDKEAKRNRGAMSCAECRRLKLKCDKTVPCSSCKRRGCSAICPNGDLITGQGTRFVLADTEKLHQKITQMSDRIRQLEDALAILQTSISPGEQHPLLQRELLDIKSIIDLHAAVNEGNAATAKSSEQADNESQYVEAFGTLALRDDGAATFYGPSAGSEVSFLHCICIIFTRIIEPVDRDKEHVSRDLPGVVKHLSNSFPLAPIFNENVDLNFLVQNYLPPWHRARQLSELYLSQAPWFFGAVTKRQLLEECLPLWYAEAADLVPPGSVAPSTETNANEASRNPHELALLFVIFCFGALTDPTLPPAPDNDEANMYSKLTRAALNLEPVLDRPPSVATVQTLALLAIYQGLCSGENSIESTWAIFGLATKLAQSVNRDCARWQLPSSEVQKRRALFWELFITDGWQSLATGRLATFYLPYIDCELANDPDSSIDDDGCILPSFPAWKAKFGFECVSAVIQNAQTAKVPKYSVIIELDRRVRDMDLPEYSKRPPPPDAGLAETMKHYMPINYHHLTLLYIHRCFFAEAVSNNPTNPMNSPFAPSFLAGYRSACELLGGLRTQFDLFPAQIARFWVLWTHAFSSSVMLASVVTHASGSGARSKITGAALSELRRAVDLFKEASLHGGRAGKFLPILQRLLQKAEHAYSTATPAVTRNQDIFASSTEARQKDELSIFSGQINKVATKVSSSSVASTSSSLVHPAGGGTDHQDRPSHTSSSPVVMERTTIPSLARLHPSLRDQWNNFEGDLNTQLSNAQRDDYYTEEDTYMLPPVDNARYMRYAPSSQRHDGHEAMQHHQHQEHRYLYHNSTDSSRHYPSTTSNTSYAVPQTRCQYSTAYYPHPEASSPHQQHWDDSYSANSYQSLMASSEPLIRGPTAQMDYYDDSVHNHHHQQQHREYWPSQSRLQETWQSFNLYVGSPRPST
ncbi:hypothetical protein F5I97DRAFT_1815347 [Phlebopus sp. FC_14]|nr:hypothetical protein F5I97DRAFT_1815347 [Phlebopus sp. FC_14]